MADECQQITDDPQKVADERRKRTSPTSSGGEIVYAIGLVGALVWYWQQADGTAEHMVGVLKAFVWPAFLVYEAFKALNRPGVDARR
jgi:hypothetical protein